MPSCWVSPQTLVASNCQGKYNGPSEPSSQRWNIILETLQPLDFSEKSDAHFRLGGSSCSLSHDWANSYELTCQSQWAPRITPLQFLHAFLGGANQTLQTTAGWRCVCSKNLGARTKCMWTARRWSSPRHHGNSLGTGDERFLWSYIMTYTLAMPGHVGCIPRAESCLLLCPQARRSALKRWAATLGAGQHMVNTWRWNTKQRKFLVGYGGYMLYPSYQIGGYNWHNPSR